MPRKNQLVKCDRHAGDQLGYVVCKHAILGAEVSQHVAPKITELGEILCQECRLLFEAGEMRSIFDDVIMICAPCALDRFAGRLPS